MTQAEFNRIIQKGLQLYYDYRMSFLTSSYNDRSFNTRSCYQVFAHEMNKTRFSQAFNLGIKASNHLSLDESTSLFLSTFATEVNNTLNTTHRMLTEPVIPPNNINLNEWLPYRRGDNNVIYISYDRKKVLRRALTPFDPITDQDRVYNLWQRINPKYPIEKKGPWLEIPFFGHTKPSDEEMNHEVIRIYRDTGIIMTDAWVEGNFLRYDGKTICVDVEHGVWRGDKISEDYVEHVLMGTHRYKTMCQNRTSQTVATICTLLYLEKFLSPEHMKPDYCTPSVIEALHHYRIKKLPINLALMETLFAADTSVDKSKKEEQHTSNKLHIAIANKDVNTVRELILEGYDVNARYADPGMTPMELALHMSQDDIALLLFKAGAAVPPATEGKYHLIHVAAKKGILKLVKRLLHQDKTLLDLGDQFKQTPLLWAAAAGEHTTAVYLINKQATINPTTQTKRNHPMDGLTALDWAEANKCTSVVQLLCQAGAKRKKDCEQQPRNPHAFFKAHQTPAERTPSERIRAERAYMAYQNKLTPHYKPEDVPRSVRYPFDELPTHAQEGWSAFASNAHQGARDAWTSFTKAGRSDVFKVMCMFFPVYNDLHPHKKEAVNHAATSLRQLNTI
jgi:hypothetical protein